MWKLSTIQAPEARRQNGREGDPCRERNTGSCSDVVSVSRLSDALCPCPYHGGGRYRAHRQIAASKEQSAHPPIAATLPASQARDRFRSGVEGFRRSR